MRDINERIYIGEIGERKILHKSKFTQMLYKTLQDLHSFAMIIYIYSVDAIFPYFEDPFLTSSISSNGYFHHPYYIKLTMISAQ